MSDRDGEFWDGWSIADVTLAANAFLAETVSVPIFDCARGTGPAGLGAGGIERAQGWRRSRVHIAVDGSASTYVVWLAGGVQASDIVQGAGSARGLVAVIGSPTAVAQKSGGSRHIVEAVRSVPWPYVSLEIQNTDGANSISLSVHFAVLRDAPGVLP